MNSERAAPGNQDRSALRPKARRARGAITLGTIACLAALLYWWPPPTVRILRSIFPRQMGGHQHLIARTKCQQYHDAIRFFELKRETRITDLRELEQPLGDVDDEPHETICEDPWGVDYWLETEGAARRVCSSGADRMKHTADDICWPETEAS